MNMLACWIEDPKSEAFKLHVLRIYDYLWLAEDGMKMKVTIAESFLMKLRVFSYIKVLL